MHRTAFEMNSIQRPKAVLCDQPFSNAIMVFQMDPKIFQSSQPQYILPEGHEQGRGMFEFALGHIGCAVGGGFFVGCARGFAGELFNQDTRRLVSFCVVVSPFLYFAFLLINYVNI